MTNPPSRPFSDAPPIPNVETPPEPVKIDMPELMLPPRKGRQGRDVIDGTSEYVMVPINDLHPDPDQPRKTMRNVGELAANIKALGLGQPVTARIAANGHLTIMYGERRWRAMQKLGWEYAPTIIRYGVTDSDVLALQLSENSQREDLDPIEEARGVRAYMRQKKLSTYLQAAEALGHSLFWVTSRIALLDLEPEQQEAVSAGKLGIVSGSKLARQQTGNTRVSKQQRESGGYSPAPVKTSRVAPHFSDEHPLAGRARARCKVHDFPKPQIGGIACGVCWEIVIRLDAGRNPLPITGRAPTDD